MYFCNWVLGDHTGERQVTARNFTSAFDEAMKKVSSLGITLTEMCTMQVSINKRKTYICVKLQLIASTLIIASM